MRSRGESTVRSGSPLLKLTSQSISVGTPPSVASQTRARTYAGFDLKASMPKRMQYQPTSPRQPSGSMPFVLILPPARNSTGAANVKALVTRFGCHVVSAKSRSTCLKRLMVHEHRAVHERYIRGTAGLDHLFYFLRVYANGFFDKNMLARRCRFQHPLLVQFGWQRDVDRINTFVREERVVALDPTHRSVQLQLVAERLRLLQLARRDGDERAALGTNDGSGILLRNRGTAHDANAHCVR